MQSGEPGGDTATVMASACKGDTRLYSHAISDPGRCAYALLHALFQQEGRSEKTEPGLNRFNVAHGPCAMSPATSISMLRPAKSILVLQSQQHPR
jgi:hypothetical protein